MDVIAGASSGEGLEGSSAEAFVCNNTTSAENSDKMASTQLLHCEDEDIENISSQANTQQSFGSPSKASSASPRPGKLRLSNSHTISERPRIAVSRTQAWGASGQRSIGTDIYIRVAGQSQWWKVVTNCHVSYHGFFDRTMKQLECHMQRAPEDPMVHVAAASFHLNGKWIFVDSQESYNEIHESICSQPRMRCRIELSELSESDPRIPRLITGTPQRSVSAGRSRPTPAVNPTPPLEIDETRRQTRPTLCECFVDAVGGESRRVDLEIDYGTSAQHVKEQLVATFHNLSSAEVHVNGAWVHVSDGESFEQHRETLLTQERVHWRLVTSNVEQRPSTTTPTMRNASPFRGRRASRTPLVSASPLRSRASATDRTPSRGKVARLSTPPRGERGASVERSLRTPTSSRSKREDAPHTPVSVKRNRNTAGPVAALAASSGGNTVRASPCRPLAIPRLREDKAGLLTSSCEDQSLPELHDLQVAAAVTHLSTSTTSSAERTAFERQTPTVESVADWPTSLRARSKPSKIKNHPRSASTGRAGAKRPNKNLSSAQSVASLGLDVTSAQAHGLSEGELFAFLQQMMGDTREEISWKLQAYREGGGFTQAEQEYQAAENDYIRLLFELDSTKALQRFIDGYDVQRALRELAKLHDSLKVDPNSSAIRDAATKQMARLQSIVARAPAAVSDMYADVVTRIQRIPHCEPGTACRKAHLLVEGNYVGSSVDRLREEIASLEQQIQVAANSLETWDKRMKAAPDYQAVIRQREEAWMAQEKSANEEALETMRSFIPCTIQQLSCVEFDEEIRAKGGFYPQELLREIKDNKLLHWVVMHPHDIKCSNFLVGATARYFSDLRQYDLVELRAILAVLPASFELDRDGAKARWRTEFLQLVKDKIARMRQNVVPGGWDPVHKKRVQVTLSALSDKEMRRACYYYPTLTEVNTKLNEFEERKSKLEQKKSHIQELEVQEKSLKSELHALVEDLRNKSLPTEYREALSNAKAELKGKAEHVKQQLHKLSNEVSATEADLTSNPINEQQLQQELEILRQQIPAYDTTHTPVLIKGVFDRCPVIAKAERNSVSKYCPEAEALLRKKELEEALGKRAAVPSIETAFAQSGADSAPVSPYVARPRRSVMETASPLVVAKLNGLFGSNKQAEATEKAEQMVNRPSTTLANSAALPAAAKAPVAPKSKTLQRLLEYGPQSPSQPPEAQSSNPAQYGKMNSLLTELMVKRASKESVSPRPVTTQHSSLLKNSQEVNPAETQLQRPPMAAMGGLFAELRARQQQLNLN